ncbi:cucumisin-like [Trifolium pratense]|uniref:cucumisin-like n=1 Tax=Trifolium pratense TaxID=57577 RepID=UPI001E69055E|nr:cucumisin-like [Trifolium pratense]
MDMRSFVGVFVLLINLTSLLPKCCGTSQDDLKTYIVYMGHKKNNKISPSFLLQEVASSNPMLPRKVIAHYNRSFSGFVAELTEDEAIKIAGYDGVVSVFSSEKRQLLTTRSWDFIGLPQDVERAQYESDIIIGVIDSGIWPESDSFNDEGMSSPPSKWKGTCQAIDFCNNKLIGARYYKRSFGKDFFEKNMFSPRDIAGHGTHIASIAAGNLVRMASMLGLGQGTIRGGASSARIAVYKACWSDGCDDVDILHAFNDAIADGVDIISVSVGGKINENIYMEDGLTIGSFHAMQHGILTVFAGGNSGPNRSSIMNVSPWAMSVAASTIDRKFVTKVKLGNNRISEGTSLNTFDLEGKLYPIIYSGDAPNKKAGFDKHSSRNCSSNSLDDNLVKGKIVLCEGNRGASEALRAGAVGVLIQGTISTNVAYNHPLPTCYLYWKDATHIRKYIHLRKTPTATILKTEELTDTLAPEVAYFSSRGPNNITLEILKPDVIGPGVDIIASWSPVALSNTSGENRTLAFNIESGTSMACPHVSGAAGYVKSFWPTWSPAAIHSALMTTAKQASLANNHDAEFAYGAGQIDPMKAVNPGLVYDAVEEDYINFLCGQGYNSTTLKLISGHDNSCSGEIYPTARDLNYPSFALKAPHPKQHVNGSFLRTVTNVGSARSTYKAIVTAPKGFNIIVKPNVLSFKSVGERQTFTVTIYGKMKKSIGSASLVWDDGEFQVRSPIIIFDERAETGAGINLYCISYIYVALFYLLFYIIVIQ